MPSNLSKLESDVKLLLEAQNKPSKIAILLKKDIESIYNTIKRIKRKNSIKEVNIIEKRGGTNKINNRVKRVIKNDIKRSPKKTIKRLIVENNLGITKRSILRILKEEKATTNVAIKKPIISAKSAKLRVIYAKEQLKKLEKKEINLKKIIFSDESCIQRGHGARQEYYRKFSSIKAGKQLISSTNKTRDISISVWGAIWIGGRSELLIIKDPQAPLPFTNSRYIRLVLNGIVKKHIKRGWKFQQDNSKIHSTKAVKSWFKRYKVSLYPHPAYSPDLNPIENIWSLLKDRLNKRPRKSLGVGLILEEWAAIDQKSIDNCILSLPRRYEAVKIAKGYQTKY